MAKLDISNNSIGALVGWTHHPGSNEEYKYRHSDGRHQGEKPADFEQNKAKPLGVIALADAIQDMGALAKLDISNNYSSGKRYRESEGSEEFIRPIASMLKTNTSLKELSLAGNNLNAEAARIFSQDIQDNGALASLDISGNSIGSEQEASIKQVCGEKSINCTS